MICDMSRPDPKTGVSYFGCRMPDHVKADMEAIKRNHCNFVVHTFSETDLEYYRGTMEKIVAFSKEIGLEVHLDPWGVGRVWGGESYSEFIAKNLEARQINGEGHSLPIACPNSPAFRSFMLRWADAAVETGADYLFWDEPHFYIYAEAEGSKGWACKCKHCEELFVKRFGHKMPSLLDEELRLFKEDSIVDFLRFLCDYTQKKSLKNSMCFLPFDNSSTVNDWSKVAKIESLEIIGTDPYWRPGQTQKEVVQKVRAFSKRINELASQNGKEGQIWILNFNIKKGEEKLIKVAVETAYGEGIRNLAAWSYYGTVQMSELASQDPALVWKTLGQAYRRLKK